MIDYTSEVDLELKRRTKMCFYHGEDDPTVTLNLVERTFAVFDEHKLNYSLTVAPGLEHKLSREGMAHISGYLAERMV